MTLKKLYLLWLPSLLASIPVGILFYIGGMLIEYGNLQGEGEFAGVVYLLTAPIIIVFCTGLFLFLIIRYTLQKEKSAKKLANNVLILHSLFALLMIASFNFIIFFINPSSFALFVLLPFFAWNITTDRKSLKKWLLFLGLIVGAIILFGVLQLFLLYTSGPGSST